MLRKNIQKPTRIILSVQVLGENAFRIKAVLEACILANNDIQGIAKCKHLEQLLSV